MNGKEKKNKPTNLRKQTLNKRDENLDKITISNFFGSWRQGS